MNLWTRLRALPALLAAPAPRALRVAELQEAVPNIPWLSPGSHLNPNLDTGTDRAGDWQELHDALRDPKASACLDLRCQVSSSLPWTLQARAGTTSQVMDLVREALEGLNLVEDFEELAKASYFGLVPCEVHWEVRRGHLVPAELESIDPYFVSFGSHREALVGGRELPTGKLILHRHGSQFRNPWGLGRGRTVPRWTRVKVAVAWATYRDYPRYAHDRLMLTYPADAGDIEQSRYIAVANRLIDAPGLVVPEGMDAKGIRLESKFEMGAKLIEAANGEIATAILGNTLTTGEGKHGTNALGNVHQEQTNRQEVADAKRIEATLNRTLIPWIVLLNFGADAVPPLFRFEHQLSSSLKERLEAAQAIGGAGLPLSATWLRSTFGIPAPVDDADAVSFQARPAAEAAVRTVREDGEDEVQLSVQEPQEAMFSLWLEGFLARQGNVARLAGQVLREAEDYPAALERLLALAKDFPVSAGEHLTQALQAARDFGGFEARSEVDALLLEEQPEMRFDLPPEAALRWLQAKVPMAVKQADQLRDVDLKARAFWVAGVEQIGLLQDLQRGMALSLAAGTPWEEFRAVWLPRLEGAGISAGRLKLAYDTQIHGAYMGGRMAELQDDDRVDNLTYVTAADESVRPNHRRLHGVTRPKGDLLWRTHTPPLGYRCRCRIRAAEAERPVTVDTDPRLGTPPDTGFGEGALSFASYLNSQARQAGAWSLVDEARPGFAWLAGTRPRTPLADAPAAGELQAGLVADPTGRQVYVPAGVPSTAVQAPSEVWLAPVASPEGELALQLAWIRPDGVLLSTDGVVSRADALDPNPYRCGVRLL